VEGIVAVVDLNKMEVLRVEDYGVWRGGVAADGWELGAQYSGDASARIVMEIDRKRVRFWGAWHEVAWQKWKFSDRVYAAEGLCCTR